MPDTKTLEDSTGETIEVWPVGTRVRHKRHSQFVGYVAGHEYHESGKISPLPYKVYWDEDCGPTLDTLGWLAIYQGNDSVELETP